MAKAPKEVDALTHDEARRLNVPTAELQSLAEQQEEAAPRRPAHYPRGLMHGREVDGIEGERLLASETFAGTQRPVLDVNGETRFAYRRNQRDVK